LEALEFGLLGRGEIVHVQQGLEVEFAKAGEALIDCGLGLLRRSCR
jgi:hypothetical protein